MNLFEFYFYNLFWQLKVVKTKHFTKKLSQIFIPDRTVELLYSLENKR